MVCYNWLQAKDVILTYLGAFRPTMFDSFGFCKIIGTDAH